MDRGLSVVYYEEGTYVPHALDRVDELLADHRTGEVHPIDPSLLDLLHDRATARPRPTRCCGPGTAVLPSTACTWKGWRSMCA
jgi:hypothetical protein